MVSFLFPLVYFLLSNAFFVYLLKKSFGRVLPLTMIISSLSYFFSQVLLKTFLIGFFINLLFAIVFIILILRDKIKGKDLTFFKGNYFTKGLYLFFILYLFVYIFDFNRCFTVWDEYSHWGVMVKEMFRLDHFYSIPESTLMVHKDYPPIISIFELFFCHLSGGYKEPYLIRGLHLLSLSLFIPVACYHDSCENKLKIFVKTILLVTSVFLLFLLFDGHNIINTIYTDYIMAILVSYLLAIILFSEDSLSYFHIMNLSLGFIFLILTKQMGFPLYLMALFLYLLDTFVRYQKNKKKELSKRFLFKLICVFLLLVVLPLLIWKGWSSYIDSLDIERQFELSDLNIMELKNIVDKTGGEEYQQKIVSNYLNALGKESITNSYIPLTYFGCLLFIVVILFIECFYYKKQLEKRKFIEVIITLIIGSFGYAFVMLILYVFSFGEVEGLALASFNRYMPTYILIGLSLCYMIFIYGEDNKNSNSNQLKYHIVLVILLLLFQYPSNIRKLLPKVKKTPINPYMYHASKISEKTESNSKIFLIVQNSGGDYQFAVKYYMNPRTTNLKYFSFPIDNIEDYKAYFDNNIKNYMVEFDYLYVITINDEIWNKYDFILKDNNIEKEQVYKIINQEKELKFKLMK